ncbi:MAG: trypsin-like peptidase domain-containing protein [Thermoleophilia bacterium]
MDGDSSTPDRSPSPWRRIGALAVPAVVGAGVALGVVGATVGFGGDTTIIRESSPGITAAPAASAAVAEAEDDGPADARSVSEIVRRESPAVVLIEAGGADGQGGLGSGFLIDRDGHVLTNAHVVEDSKTTTVTFSDGTERTARILGVDTSTDLAVLKIPRVPEGIQPVRLGSSGALVVGQDVVAIGNPYGLERTATTGIVSALERTIEAPNGFAIQNAIQTDAAINQGNSGGPLFDRAGRVIGMNTQIASQNGGNVGLGFAVPIDTIAPIAQSVIKDGTPKHAWIGITGRELTPALAGKLGLEGRRGVLVAEVADGGAAKAAGIVAARDSDAEVPRGADLIIAVNGTPVEDMADVSRAVASRTVGERISVTVLRDGEERTVQMTLRDRPAGVGVR